jgi:NADPH2:quinone reductase
MKAVVCEAFGGPEVLALRELPDPPAPGAGEVQVRIRARGAQYVDVLMLAGKYQFRPEPPFIPGSEAAGEVVAVGPDVARFRIGDRVMSRHRLGALAELGNANAENCDLIPGGLSLEEAAVFRGAYGTAYHALLQRGRLAAGDRVLVHGAAGGIGIPAIQLAKLFGAEVVATASTEEKRSVCRAEGADHAIDYTSGFRDKVMELTGGRATSLHMIRSMVGPSRNCCAASPGAGALILGFRGPALARTSYLLIKDRSVGVRGGLNEAPPGSHSAANAEASRGCGARRIWRRFPLAEAATVMQALIDREVIGKAVLVG